MQSIRKQYLSLIQNCWRYAQDQRPMMVLIYVLFLFANICFMAQPYIIGELVNTLQRGGDNLLGGVIFWLALHVGAMFAFWVFHGPARIIERRLAFHIRKNFNAYFYDIIARLPIRWQHDHHSGNILHRVQKASTGLFQFAEHQFQFFENIVRFGIIFIALAFIDWRVSLGLLVLTLLSLVMLSFFDRLLVARIRQVNEGEHTYYAHLFDVLSNIYNIITFNLRRKSTDDLNKKIDDFYPSFRSLIIVNEVKWFFLNIFLVAMHFCVLLAYIWFHLQPDEVLMIGTLVAIFQYMQRLDKVFFQVGDLMLKVAQYRTDFGATDPVEEAFEAKGTRDDHLPALHTKGGAIDFNNLKFTYDDKNHIFDNLDLHIKAGERIGLIGPSGAGKTSLVNLLLRFDRAQDLDIRIDGQKITDVNAHSLREAIALIPQDTTLFQSSLMDNIRDGKLNASDEEVVAAAKRAHAHEFISSLPEGYETFVGERGVKLSGGQRQRIAIARAILKDAPILVLDEATSALDSESEKLIQESFADLMDGKTVIAIAHRLSTIAHLDRLIVMEKGCIVEQGSHKELLKRGGLYAKLWNMQSGGFLGD